MSATSMRWGILSAGKISSDFAKAISITQGSTASAVAARSLRSAKAFAHENKIPKYYGSYDALISDPEIDVLYVGTIADTHASIARKALLSRKPVVVEKPFTTSLSETMSLVHLARKQNVFLMEGMCTRCFPAIKKVRQLISEGVIGDVVCVQGDFGWSTAGCSPDHRIWHTESGGMILDIGMYMAQLGQIAFANAPYEKVMAMGTHENRVDMTCLVNIMYQKPAGNKGMLQFYITGEANTEERITIQGTQGRIIIRPPAHAPTIISLQTDQVSSDETIYEYPTPDDSFATWNYTGSIGFTYQISDVAKALLNGHKECSHFTLDDSLQIAMILDEISEQVREQQIPGVDVEKKATFF